MKIHLSGFTDSEERIVHAVLTDFAKLMKMGLDNVKLSIINMPDRPYPMTCPKRMNMQQREDYIIYLCFVSGYWCQMIYQLAHELGHFYMNCYPEKKGLKWLSECLCELFSMIFLHRISSFFQSFSPIYVSSVKNYVEEHIQNAISFSELSCSQLIAEKLKELEDDPTENGTTGRPRNCFIAACLYKVLGNAGKGLSAVCLFEKLNQLETINEFFNIWLNECRSYDESNFVKTIKCTLGII